MILRRKIARILSFISKTQQDPLNARGGRTVIGGLENPHAEKGVDEPGRRGVDVRSLYVFCSGNKREGKHEQTR
jgi:hypothetical protein